MDNDALKKLDFIDVLRILSELASSTPGKEACLSIMPANDLNEVLGKQEFLKEYFRFKNCAGGFSFSGLCDVRQELTLAKIGSLLMPETFLKIAEILSISNLVKQNILSEKNDFPILSDFVSTINFDKAVKEKIHRVFDSDGNIKTEASKTLAVIRNKIAQKHNAIIDRLKSIIYSQTYSKLLMEPIYTTRQDRYVLLVRQEFQNAFPGIVHDHSTSKATVYMEPQVIIRDGNELKALKHEEKQEINRIITELTFDIADIADWLQNNIIQLIELDVYKAKTEFLEKYRAIVPEMNNNGIVEIIDARHPLLGEKAVPVSVSIGDGYHILVITGPNTGGKTVALKTTGLFCFMAKCGLPVPAKYGTKIAFFDNIFTDIGDEQSIAQNLSTFSSHITNIIRIVNNVSSKSLVLLDEIGAGTDPAEGTSLAISVLEYFRNLGVRVIATTHYTQLKIYASETSQVRNAAVLFDDVTLDPLYVIRMDLPGKSCALNIAKRLGLRQEILDGAKNLLSSDFIKLDNLLDDVEKGQVAVVRLKSLLEEKIIVKDAEIDLYIKLREHLREEYNRKIKGLKQNYEKLAGKFEEERLEISDKFELLEKELKEKKAETINEDKLEDLLQRMNFGFKKTKEVYNFIKNEGSFPKDRKEEKPFDGTKLQKGDIVRFSSMRSPVKILDFMDNKVEVQSGNIRIMLEKKDIIEKLTQVTKKDYIPEKRIIKRAVISPEIHLRGLFLEDAILELDKYIEDAVMAEFSPIRIVHGKGQGILRKNIHDYLRSHPRVKDFRIGDIYEGGMGVTVAVLDV